MPTLRCMVAVWAMVVTSYASVGCAPVLKPVPASESGLRTYQGREPTKPGVRAVYIANESKHVVRITSFTLYECRNISTPCGEHPLSLRLEPAAHDTLVVLVARDRAQEMRFRVSYDWVVVSDEAPPDPQ